MNLTEVNFSGFQYRKRYEVTCDGEASEDWLLEQIEFQYRKRYEVTCDEISGKVYRVIERVSIPQAV